MTAKEILTKVRALFDAPVEQPAAAAAPAASAVTVSCYPVDGGQPVFVDNSDDGVADIDVNDKVFSDGAMATAYPDGSYKITGTAFGFTVAGGVVSSVDDATGAGPGMPMPPETALAAPAAPPAKTLEERIAAIETSLATLTQPPVTTGLATQVELQAEAQKITDQEARIKKQDEVINGLFELVEALTKAPGTDPVTIPSNKTQSFQKKEQKNETLNRRAEALKKMRQTA